MKLLPGILHRLGCFVCVCAVAWFPAALPPGATEEAAVGPAARVRHLQQLGTERWHTAGHRGQGVKVAVLDSGLRGYQQHLGKGLPPRVTARSFRTDGNLEARDSQHGVLCGEVVHAIAPGTQLLFANWEPDGAEHLLRAVRWARVEGARIITCSVITPRFSDGEGGGAVHAELARIVQEGDLLFFACAGNTAQRHWSGSFRSGRDGCHEWQAGQIDNAIRPWGDDRVCVELCRPAGADYELSVYEADSGNEVGRACTSDGSDQTAAVVRFQPQAERTYRARVRHLRGPAGAFHLVVLGGDLERHTAQGSISFPGDGPAVVTVGAVDAEGRRERYSACGPNSPRPKPDLVAPVPFPTQLRERPFGGTSAAAPQAAGLAALMWSRHPEWSAAQVRAALQTAARDLGPTGHDWETGFGLVRLPKD